jgi:hypothetical protein
VAGPLDPGSGWLAAGITGLARQREWDAVATADAPGTPGDEVEFVALADGRLLVESRPPGLDPGPLAAALGDSIRPPYRALALRRNDLWAVGASAIEVVRLDPEPAGDDLELAWDGSTLSLVSDGISLDPNNAPALERIAREREHGSYAAQAHRLDGDLFELVVLPL